MYQARWRSHAGRFKEVMIIMSHAGQQVRSKWSSASSTCMLHIYIYHATEYLSCCEDARLSFQTVAFVSFVVPGQCLQPEEQRTLSLSTRVSSLRARTRRRRAFLRLLFGDTRPVVLWYGDHSVGCRISQKAESGWVHDHVSYRWERYQYTSRPACRAFHGSHDSPRTSRSETVTETVSDYYSMPCACAQPCVKRETWTRANDAIVLLTYR